MAYREVRMMDIDQVIRRWLAGEKIQAIARSTGSDRNTVRRIVRLAGERASGRRRRGLTKESYKPYGNEWAGPVRLFLPAKPSSG